MASIRYGAWWPRSLRAGFHLILHHGHRRYSHRRRSFESCGRARQNRSKEAAPSPVIWITLWNLVTYCVTSEDAIVFSNQMKCRRVAFFKPDKRVITIFSDREDEALWCVGVPMVDKATKREHWENGEIKYFWQSSQGIASRLRASTTSVCR